MQRSAKRLVYSFTTSPVPSPARPTAPALTHSSRFAVALLIAALSAHHPQALAQNTDPPSTITSAESGPDIDPTQIRKVGGSASAPVVIFPVTPKLTEEARAAKLSGTVIVAAIIDTSGIPRNVHVVRGAGMGLDQSAVDAITQYRFKPAMKAGKPIAAPVNIRVNFEIKKNDDTEAPGTSEPAAATAAPPPTSSVPLTPTSTDPYAAEPIVILHADHLFSMAADGTGWLEHTFAVRLQSDTSVKQYGILNVPYASASEHVELEYVRAHHPDGSLTETRIVDAMEMPSPVTREAPFYSDQKELQLPIRNLRVGDTVEWKYRIVRTCAQAPGQFWGQEVVSTTAVVLTQTIELRVPAGLAVNVWSPGQKPVEATSSATAGTPAQHIYHWAFSQLKPTVGKAAEAEAVAKKNILWTPEQELDAQQGKLPAIAWSTFKSWQQVGAWYRSLEADRIIPDETVKAKAAELTAGKTTDEAKVRALYDYVATNIRYIGVAFGIGRFQPHTASEILANQYGDCKDKHTLLAALLAAEGLHADAVLIGPGIRFNPDVPSPSAFNHLITHITLSGKPIWLDTTAEVAPWGMLVSTTRDKQALVIPFAPSAEAVIVRTPPEPALPDVVTLQSDGSLEANGNSTSHLVLTFQGDSEIPARSVSRRIQPAQYDKLAEILARTMGFSASVTNAEITRPTDTSQPFQLSFDSKREKAGDWDHLRTLPEVIPVTLPRVTDIDPPVRAIQLGLPRTQDSTSTMKLPDGWTAVMPPSVHAECPYAVYDMTYRLEGSTIHVTRHVAVLAKEVPVSRWKAYRSWIDAVNPGHERYIQLLNTSKNSGRFSPGALSGSQAPAVTLGQTQPAINSDPITTQIQDALKSSNPELKNNVAHMLADRREHLSDAQTLAEQAVNLEENETANLVSMDDKVQSFGQMGALGACWQTLGWVNFQQDQQKKAEAYMRAAWELKPRNPEINLSMGLIEETLHKTTDAIVFYRMALRGTALPTDQAKITARLSRLGAASIDSLPPDVVLPLPTLSQQPKLNDIEPVVDILLTRGKPAIVELLDGDPALAQPLTEAIRAALRDPFPDQGPEKVLCRAHLVCSSSAKPDCALHFLGSQVAMQQSASSGMNQQGRN